MDLYLTSLLVFFPAAPITKQYYTISMQLITLNIWGGHIHDPLLEFFKRFNNIDIFCLQEVYYKADKKITDEERKVHLDIFSEIQASLPNHHGYFKGIVNDNYGIGIFIKSSLEVINEGEIMIHKNPQYSGIGPTHSRVLQWLKYTNGRKNYTIMNAHGLWNGKGKTDTPARIIQSHNIKKFSDNINTAKVLCGDFNLKPNTESLNIIQENMNNLVQEYNIMDTRTEHYKKAERFADYIFTSNDINVNYFSAIKETVSDHKALLVDFN